MSSDDPRTPDLAAKAASHLRHAVRHTRTIELPGGVIEVWRSRGRSPSGIAPYFVGPEGEFFRTNASMKSFQKLLRLGRPDFSDTKLLSTVIGMGPGRRILATDEMWVPKRYLATDWQPRVNADRSWSGYCVDHGAGRWEHMVIDEDYTLTVKRVG